jgi:hypothetical protein
LARLASRKENFWEDGLPGSMSRHRRKLRIYFVKSGDELFKAGEVVDWQETVDIRKGGLHAAHAGLVAFLAKPGVEPDEAVAAALKAGELAA